MARGLLGKVDEHKISEVPHPRIETPPTIRLVNEISTVNAPNKYNALGADPYLIVEQPTDAGYLRLRFELCFPKSSDRNGHARFAQVFTAGRNGINEADSWTFDASAMSTRFDEIVYSSQEIKFIRLDPSNKPGPFVFNGLDVRVISSDDAQALMFGRWRDILQNSDDAWRTGPLIADFFHLSRMRNFTQALADPQRVQGDRYAAWVARRQIDKKLHAALSKGGRKLKIKPRFSTLMPT